MVRRVKCSSFLSVFVGKEGQGSSVRVGSLDPNLCFCRRKRLLCTRRRILGRRGIRSGHSVLVVKCPFISLQVVLSFSVIILDYSSTRPKLDFRETWVYGARNEEGVWWRNDTPHQSITSPGLWSKSLTFSFLPLPLPSFLHPLPSFLASILL